MGGRKRVAALSMVQQSKQLAAAHKKQKLTIQLQHEKEKLLTERKLAKKKAAARSPYKPHHSLLLIGEGNFSFARSLIDTPPSTAFTPLPGRHITATCYDSFAVARDKYADVQDNIDALRAAGVRVWDNVDATQLHSNTAHFPSSAPPPLSHYDFVIFNFPHTGSGITDTHKNIVQHQQLLIAFLHSLSLAPHILSPATRVHVTVKTGEPYTSWHLPLLTRSLPAHIRPTVRFLTSFPFYSHLYPLYAHRRTIGYKSGVSGEGNVDIEGGAMTYVFRRVVDSSGVTEKEKADDDEVRLIPLPEPSAMSEETWAERVLSGVSENVSDSDEQSAADDEPTVQRRAETATDKPVKLLVVPTHRVQRKVNGEPSKRTAGKRSSQQPKSKFSLRGLLFT